MTTSLDVLLLESHPGISAAVGRALDSAGHRVVRCHTDESSAFACAGLAEGGECPVEGPVDVALVVRRGVVRNPTPTEGGVRCALRAGIPVVEHGVDLLDPYAPWIAARVDDTNLVEGCEAAAEARNAAVAAAIAEAVAPVLDGAGLDPEDLRIEVEPSRDRLVVHLYGTPAVGAKLGVDIGVRTVGAVRDHSPINRSKVSVQFHQGV